jgi:hypothetical protein
MYININIIGTKTAGRSNCKYEKKIISKRIVFSSAILVYATSTLAPIVKFGKILT